jgi:hypothetical protein
VSKATRIGARLARAPFRVAAKRNGSLFDLFGAPPDRDRTFPRRFNPDNRQGRPNFSAFSATGSPGTFRVIFPPPGFGANGQLGEMRFYLVEIDASAF